MIFLFDRRYKVLTINGIISITGATYGLLDCFANETLRGAGKDWRPWIIRCVGAAKLAPVIDLSVTRQFVSALVGHALIWVRSSPRLVLFDRKAGT